jgi:polysaccharide deacetylase 2 family uncharacterized protein YibQ
VKLAFSSDDRLLPPPGDDEPSRWGGTLIYGLLVPFTLLAVGLGGWYMVTGETPLALFDRLSHGPRIALPMPARPGGDKPAEALMKPPGPSQAPALSPAQLPAPPPSAPAAQPPAPAPAPEAKPAGPPQVTLPSTAPAPAAPPPEQKAAPTSTFVAPPPPPMLDEPAIPPAGDSLAPPSFAQLPTPRESSKPLPPAPLPELLRQTPTGPLPIRAGGKEAWRAYARPVSVAQTKPGTKIAVVVTGLGLSGEGTQAAIGKLPPEIDLSFSPYGSGLAEQIKKARENGHEVLLDLPLEPVNFPAHDAGPLAVLQSHSPGEALGHLDTVLGKATSYVGLAAPLRSPVTATESWPLMLQELKDRGLLLVGDGLVGIDDKAMPAAAQVTLVADETPFRTAVDAKLARVLAAAQRDGSAILYISARPISFERLLAFIASFPEKNVTLVPVSALVRPEP